MSSTNFISIDKKSKINFHQPEVSSTTTCYEAALREAEEETSRLIQRRADDEKRISELRITIANLRRIAGLPTLISGFEPKYGLTAMIRDILNSSEVELSPREIRDRLIELGIEIGDYSNLLASVHVCLTRLASSGKIQRIEEGNRKKYKNNYEDLKCQ